VISRRDLHEKKPRSPISSTLDGIVIFFKPAEEKADGPIRRNFDPDLNATSQRDSHSKKHFSPITHTSAGITTLFIFLFVVPQRIFILSSETSYFSSPITKGRPAIVEMTINGRKSAEGAGQYRYSVNHRGGIGERKVYKKSTFDPQVSRVKAKSSGFTTGYSGGNGRHLMVAIQRRL
jgi:hypothetical protein